MAAAVGGYRPLRVLYAANHWSTAIGHVQHNAADEKARWAETIARLGYGTRHAPRAGIDLDQAARDFLLRTIPVQPRLPQATSRANEVTRATQFLPQPDCRHRPVRQATADRIEAGRRRFQQQAGDRIQMYGNHQVHPTPATAGPLDVSRLVTDLLRQGPQQEPQQPGH